jgi:hypothetical protein
MRQRKGRRDNRGGILMARESGWKKAIKSNNIIYLCGILESVYDRLILAQPTSQLAVRTPSTGFTFTLADSGL